MPEASQHRTAPAPATLILHRKCGWKSPFFVTGGRKVSATCSPEARKRAKAASPAQDVSMGISPTAEPAEAKDSALKELDDAKMQAFRDCDSLRAETREVVAERSISLRPSPPPHPMPAHPFPRKS